MLSAFRGAVGNLVRTDGMRAVQTRRGFACTPRWRMCPCLLAGVRSSSSPTSSPLAGMVVGWRWAMAIRGLLRIDDRCSMGWIAVGADHHRCPDNCNCSPLRRQRSIGRSAIWTPAPPRWEGLRALFRRVACHANEAMRRARSHLAAQRPASRVFATRVSGLPKRPRRRSNRNRTMTYFMAWNP